MHVTVTVKTVFSSPVHFLAFGFGSGLSPFAPGTAGTLAAIPLYLLLVQLPLWGYVAVLLAMSLVGIWICGESSRRLGVHDHGGIVWDEFAGFLLTMLAAPTGWVWIVVGFFLFRLFDIWKPWPIRLVDRDVPGGFGIMFDDILAGIYAWIALQVLARLVGA
ncbi:phosphatidylglycerophosphatase A family protein [Thiothrix subterranea]|uniref:Phosphatidylglycerophosphatase A n=1 Tax=Thiothrix subterranea TaxID=2735563 RepID=A0AA51QZ50_9GAMM|nr:phosphatidylglycerophosphatase A [Thiothrix subterranea]MDQ5767269.1 phosphatidylglycerophosphatase A [Thiothrix subterranea]WML88868.1 phosphatidylglycerophosphatase A [Thiothrix subterranea]